MTHPDTRFLAKIGGVFDVPALGPPHRTRGRGDPTFSKYSEFDWCALGCGPLSMQCRSRNGAVRFKCAINVGWLDLMYVSTPHVPLTWASVETMQAQYFDPATCGVPSSPTCWSSLEVEVGILKSHASKKTFGKKGSWKRTSPDEIVMALFKSIADAIRKNEDEDFDVLGRSGGCQSKEGVVKSLS